MFSTVVAATAAGAVEDETTEPFDATVTSYVATASTPLTSAEVPGRSIRQFVVLTVTVLTITSNSFAIFIINSKKQGFTSDKLWEVRLVTSLFYSDLILGLMMCLGFVCGYWPEVADFPKVPKVQMFFMNWCGCCSIYNMAAVSFVKMLAIARPLHFEQEVTSKRCWAGIAAAWLFTFVLSVPILTDFVEPNYVKALYISNMKKGVIVLPATFALLVYIPATSIIVLSYWKIFMIVLKHKMQINDTSVLSGSSNTSYQSVFAGFKSAKKILVIIAVYFAVYTPLLVLVVSGDNASPETQGKWHAFIITWISLGNSCYNSMLYITMHKRTRATVREIFFCQKDSDNVPLPPRATNA